MTRIIRKLLNASVVHRRGPDHDLLDKRCDCAVSLVDRRTGQTPYFNGRPLTVITRDPTKAIAELLQGRDRAIWEIRVQALHPGLS